MRKFARLICLALGALSLSSYADELVIIHTNDTHSQIDPVKGEDLGGVGRRKVLIDSIRAAHDNVLLIDAGDVVQGSLFFNLYKGELEEKLFNALGYDMRILGNHEFDNGMERLAEVLQTAQAELLCSNYDTRNTPLDGLFKPYSIREVAGKRIAFMPINLQPAGMISARNTVGLGYADAFEAADALAWYLKNIEHADAIVAITHIGYTPDTQLLEKSKNIDVLIGGHSHTLVDPALPDSPPYTVKNADGRDVLIAQAGKSGRHIGEIVINLDSLGSALPEYKLIAVDKRLDPRVDPSIEEIIKPYRSAVDELYVKKVARADRTMERNDPELLNFAADFLQKRANELADSVDMVIINRGGLRITINKGDVYEGDIITLMPFFNRAQVIEITGRQLAEAFNTMAAAGGNGVSANVSAYFDPNTGKCTEVLISGKHIDPDRIYRIGTIDYVAEGGDYFSSLTDHKLIAESPNLLFEDMLNYFKSIKGHKGKIASSPEPRMKRIASGE